MKNIIFSATLITASFFMSVSYGQRLKTEQISYSYIRLPVSPVKGITNYQVSFEAAYEAKNQQALKDYNDQKKAAEEKYRKDLAAYTIMVKAANERYDKEMIEYNKKSFGSKLAEKSLLDNNKPVKETVQKPYVAFVSEPKLQSSYDYKIMADTYIQLEGFTNLPTEALKIIVVLYGYDHTQPRTMSEQKEYLNTSGSGGTTKSTNYHAEFSYRHPMAVKVNTPDGKELLSLTPPELNSYKIYKSGNTTQPTAINSELLIKTTEEKVLQDNLSFINNLLNDRYGFSSVKRVATLYYVKDDQNYSDMNTGFNEASSGLLMLQQDSNAAKIKLKKACDLWNAALKESDLQNKKARINKDITLALFFNLLEAYYASGDVVGGQTTLDKLNTMTLSNTDRHNKFDYDILFSDLKNRQQHN